MSVDSRHFDDLDLHLCTPYAWVSLPVRAHTYLSSIILAFTNIDLNENQQSFPAFLFLSPAFVTLPLLAYYVLFP